MLPSPSNRRKLCLHLVNADRTDAFSQASMRSIAAGALTHPDSASAALELELI